MAHLHKKIKKGRPYYYIREIARVNGKPTVVNQVYLGSPERMLELATTAKSQITRIQVQEFGALWLANLIEQEMGFAGLIDSVITQGEKKKGPSVGEYFLYAVFNRMIDTCSKRKLPEWYSSTAIQQVRPVDIKALSSRQYWKKWDKVDVQALQEIAKRFFQQLIRLEPPRADCFMFDTTNYFTFMASDTESELAARGKNKAGRNWLRQVGVALLVARDNSLPLFYREYEGNRHDSKVFLRVMNEVFEAMLEVTGDAGEMTIVFDKGMNAEDNIAAIDGRDRVHFITTYSTYYAEELIHVDLTRFQPIDTAGNRELSKKGRSEDQITAWRTTGEYWGRLRTVVVTYNPRTATKQRYGFDKKILKIQHALLEIKEKVNRQAPHWRSKKQVLQRYLDICSQIHLPADLYNVELYEEEGRLRMNYRKNHYRISRHIDRFGKNVIITDNMQWSTDEIVQASLDRYVVENSFRQTKNDDLVGLMPLRHWTDSKIRCHILSCIVALAYLRIIENRLRRAGLAMTAQTAMEHMHRLHSCLVYEKKSRKPARHLEEPTDIQAEILQAFGYKICGGVLQGVQALTC